jgi:hypothetical protein
MPTILMGLYVSEMLVLMVAMGYVFVLFIKKSKVFNKHLQGNRLKVAGLLPILWFAHVYTEAYTVYYAGESVGWRIPSNAIQLKIIMQLISLIGGLILAFFVMGCKFGDK